ncbi:MAG: AraC family transcriptional regulator ligand-binding domain-containing protein [Deltaproteobacteria bacterium]|nr:AraC family transcriptional regulator ligand-binding domain-containing protein [Deltaproteobacteria bacterium]MBW2386332.1 AraC family transcriptional regulator ligand-binding domain-containing protein [Deltaproteobacteria bacterium]MBW2696798.1 AraC family transcriptional regulator ligand-binding domain-containing protein [Deltaproteobacteria bacterium]
MISEDEEEVAETLRVRGSVSFKLIAGMIAAGETYGVDPEAALRAVKIDPKCLTDPDVRVPVVKEQALWNELAERSGDPYFGLHAQRHFVPGAIDVLDYVFRRG